MSKKRTAEQEPIVALEGASAAARAKTPKALSQKARSPRTRAKAVTHQHAKTTMIAETPAMPAGMEVAARATEPSHEEIARLSYSYWEARGYQGGSPDGDWLRAVHELRNR